MTSPKRKVRDDDERVKERQQMVEEQLIGRGIEHKAVLQSMRTVPRHLFVPSQWRQYAYKDGALPIGEGQTISQPYIVALMAAALEPNPSDRVLEIGTGSGYSAAVLSQIVSMVYTIERLAGLAREAETRLQALHYDNIRVRVGDGTKGWPEEAPFDGIIVTAGAPVIPSSLCAQLVVGGRLVIPVERDGYQELVRVRHTPEGNFPQENLGEVRFVPLIGEEGWDGHPLRAKQ
jgi:protein-L-isoaspartate(D-aspartate) O-methyltransferase